MSREIFIVILRLMGSLSMDSNHRVCHGESGSVTCIFQGPEDFLQISDLPNDTKELLVTFPEKPLSKVSNLDLHHLRDLEKLTLQPPSSYSGVCLTPTVLDGEGLFDGLGNLRELAIHICIEKISPELLRNLKSLEVLDLSHTSHLDIDNLAAILGNISDAHLPVHTLNLTAIQGAAYPSAYKPIDVRDDIFRHIGNLPLRVLDLRQNAVIEYKAGLMQYAQNMEKLSVDSSVYFNILSDWEGICVVMDWVMHPALTELDMSSVTSSSNHLRLRRYLGITDFLNQALSLCIEGMGVVPCDVANCVCRNITSFGCNNRPLPADIVAQLLNTEHGHCVGNINIPLPRRLTRLRFRYPILFSGYSAQESGKDFCMGTKNELRYLDVSGNQLGLFLSPSNVSSYGLNKLEYLDLRSNQLRFTPYSRFLHHLPSLKILMLEGNTVSFGSGNNGSHLFRDSPNIEILGLTNCGILAIPRLELSHLTKLTELDLSMNSLREFDLDVENLKQLHLLNLTGNQLQTLPQRVTDQLEMLTSHEPSQQVTVDLSQNPLLCQCDNLEFLRWIQTTTVKLAHKEGLTCFTGETGGQVSPFQLHLNDLHNKCIRLNEILGFTLGVAGFVAVAIAGYFAYRKRWRLTYWMHTARETWRRRMAAEGLRAGRGDQRQYVYDAFVAYSTHGQERSWFHMTLREKLENEYGFKLCIHYRDFKLARAIDECIVEAINKSRKTILVLSPEFLNSGWCQFEVKMASEKLIEERRDTFVIVIFRPLDEPGTKIPKKLMRLLEKKIYVEWTEDPDGQKLFWDRLVDALKEDAPHVDAFRKLNDADAQVA